MGLWDALAVNRIKYYGIFTAVFKKVVGTHFFFALFGPIGAHFSSQPLRQPHGTTASHIVKVNHTVVEKELGSG